MVVLATIPMLGTFLVWVPAAIFLAVTGHVAKALVLTFWGAVVIGMADNLLRPRLVGDRAQMHELLIFFSVLGGLQVFGVIGHPAGASRPGHRVGAARGLPRDRRTAGRRRRATDSHRLATDRRERGRRASGVTHWPMLSAAVTGGDA